MNIAVVGAGGAGAVFSMILSKNGHTVTILAPDAEQAKNLSETHVSPWLKDLTLPQDIEYTADPAVVTGKDMVVFACPSFAMRQECQTVAPYLRPFSAYRVSGALRHFVWPCRVQTLHQDVAVDKAHADALGQRQRDLKARVALEPRPVDRNDRDLRHIEILQGLSEQRHVVAGAARTACLAHEDRRLIEVQIPGLQI